MIENNLWKFGVFILVVGTPVSVFSVMYGTDQPDWWIVFMAPFTGLTLMLIDLKRRGVLTQKLARLCLGALMIFVGIAIILWGRGLVIRGTMLSAGWVFLSIGLAGIIASVLDDFRFKS